MTVQKTTRKHLTTVALIAPVPTSEATYQRAKALVVDEGKASPSFVQRRLGITYSRAVELVDRLEADGIVSRRDELGKRVVLAQGVQK